MDLQTYLKSSRAVEDVRALLIKDPWATASDGAYRAHAPQGSYVWRDEPCWACEVCRDTHRMWLSASERHVMCTYCPRPCQLCRSGPFCAQTPCPCKCHKQESGR